MKFGLLEDIVYCCWEKKDNSYLFVMFKEKRKIFEFFFFNVWKLFKIDKSKDDMWIK